MKKQLLLTVIFITKITFSQTCFTSAITNSIYNSSISILGKGDLNNDGFIDIVSGDFSSFSLQISLGNGTGSVTPTSTLSLNGNLYSLKITDVNLDGKNDIVTVGNGVSIFYGNGLGNISSTYTINTSFTSDITFADFNLDSKIDFAIVRHPTNDCKIYLGNGLNSFTLSNTFTVGSSPYSIASGDFNNDSKIDIVVSNNNSNNISVLIGNGVGGILSTTNYTTGTNPRNVIAVDLNNDNFIDIATSNSGSNNVSIFNGNGTGNYSISNTYSVGNTPVGITSCDINNDSFVDIAVLNKNSNNISFLLGSNSNNYNLFNTINSPSGSSSFFIADLNNDNKEDVSLSCSTCYGANVYLNCNTLTNISDSNNYYDDIKIFPNPIQTYIILNLNNKFNKYELFDISGNQIKSEDLNSDQIKIEFENLPSSIYFIKLISENKIIVKKIIKTY